MLTCSLRVMRRFEEAAACCWTLGTNGQRVAFMEYIGHLLMHLNAALIPTQRLEYIDRYTMYSANQCIHMKASAAIVGSHAQP